MKALLRKLLNRQEPTQPTSKTTPEVPAFKYYGFDPNDMPYTQTQDFVVISMVLEGNPLPVYGVFNRMTGHTELIFSQLSAAVLGMQTCQQTFDRVKTGEANGYHDYSQGPPINAPYN